MSEHGAFGNVAPSIRHCGLSAARTTHPLLIGQSAAPGGARGTAAQLRVAEVSANTAYLSHGNLETVVRAGGMPNIPVKWTTVGPMGDTIRSRLYHVYAFNREAFL